MPEIIWNQYPVRTCYASHHCELCKGNIHLDQRYYDGGYGKRAHDLCAQAELLEREANYPVIFCDIDGVLISLRSFQQFKTPGKPASADPSCVAQLNQILRETQALIVLSSSWRIARNKPKRHREMNRTFRQWLVGSTIHDFTPLLHTTEGDITLSAPRGREIQTWLNNHPHVKRFAILDDDADMEHLKPFLIQTSFDTGLTQEKAEAVVRMLTTQEEHNKCSKKHATQ